ncbi:Structural maintenance of chromosomes protein 3 [Linum perenne]
MVYNLRHKGKNIKELEKMLHNYNEELQKLSHVNNKALDQYQNFFKQRKELEEREAELDAGDEKIKELIKVLDQRNDESTERTFKASFAGELLCSVLPWPSPISGPEPCLNRSLTSTSRHILEHQFELVFKEVFEKSKAESPNFKSNLILFLADNDPSTNLSWCPDESLTTLYFTLALSQPDPIW